MSKLFHDLIPVPLIRRASFSSHQVSEWNVQNVHPILIMHMSFVVTTRLWKFPVLKVANHQFIWKIPSFCIAGKAQSHVVSFGIGLPNFSKSTAHHLNKRSITQSNMRIKNLKTEDLSEYFISDGSSRKRTHA